MAARAKSIGYIKNILGQEATRLSILSSCALALVSFFYIYTIGSYLKVTVYSLQNRVTYISRFDNYVIDRYTDHIIIVSIIIVWFIFSLRGKVRLIVTTIYGVMIITSTIGQLESILEIGALLSIPIAISFLIYNKLPLKKNKGKKDVTASGNFLVVNYLAIIGIIIGVIGIIFTLVPIFSNPSYSVFRRNYAYDIFLLFSTLSPLLMLLLISYLPVKFFVRQFTNLVFKIKNHEDSSTSSNVTTTKSKTRWFYLLLVMLLSAALALIPHIPAINKDNQYVGVDTVYYIDWIEALVHSHSSQEFIQQAFVKQSLGDRPLSLILLYSIQKAGNTNLASTIEYLPILLAPILVLVVYFLTRELTLNDSTALLGSFVTAVSFQPLIGIYAGLYANWLSLIIGYLSFVFLIKYLKVQNKKSLFIYLTLIISLLFVHVYTWSIIAIITSIFLICMLKFNLKYYHKKSIALLLLIILCSVVVDITRGIVIGSSGGIEKDFDVATTTGAGIQQFASRWSSLSHTIYTIVGGQFSNFIVLTLGIYWILISDLHSSSTILIVICLSVGLVAFLFGSTTIQTRIFYDIPFQIPAAIAISDIRKRAGTFITVPIGIWLIMIAIQFVSNFYLVLPL